MTLSVNKREQEDESDLCGVDLFEGTSECARDRERN
jgi:hypothetical protein